LTGAATWSYHAATAYILGIRPDYAGLRIDPVIPAAWDAFQATRRFRGARYDIRVRNLDGVQRGVRSIRVDGADVDPRQPLPVAPAGAKVDVEVYMG
jgi:cellobiose phosphorylase